MLGLGEKKNTSTLLGGYIEVLFENDENLYKKVIF